MAGPDGSNGPLADEAAHRAERLGERAACLCFKMPLKRFAPESMLEVSVRKMGPQQAPTVWSKGGSGGESQESGVYIRSEASTGVSEDYKAR